MLVLGRVPGQSVDLYRERAGKPREYLGRVTVCRFRGSVVKIGFNVPLDVVVVRSELDVENPPVKGGA